MRSLEARVATCEGAEAEAASASAVLSEERERARHEVRETAASAMQYASGANAEIERLKSSLAAYKTIGPEFEGTVERFAKLQSEIKGRRWAVEQLQRS